ncbi:MAG: tetratricopeptide repeat protein [Rhodospirillales bacterium]|nr:tetratricopeptide repeat protein [Rhodospirillales bacterium]
MNDTESGNPNTGQESVGAAGTAVLAFVAAFVLTFLTVLPLGSAVSEPPVAKESYTQEHDEGTKQSPDRVDTDRAIEKPDRNTVKARTEDVVTESKKNDPAQERKPEEESKAAIESPNAAWKWLLELADDFLQQRPLEQLLAVAPVVGIFIAFVAWRRPRPTVSIPPVTKEAIAREIGPGTTRNLSQKDIDNAAEAVEAANKGKLHLAEGLLKQSYEDSAKAAAKARQRETQANKQQAEAARHLAAVVFVNNIAEAKGWYEKAARLDPDDPRRWLDYGDAAVAAGSLGEAETAYHAALDSAAKTGDLGQRTRALFGLGDVQQDKGDLAAAEQTYRQAMAIDEARLKDDSGHAGWQRDLSVSHNKIGDVQVAQGNLSAALQSFQASLDIAERLAADDPGHAGRQYDLAASFWRMANIARHQNDREGELRYCRSVLTIMQRLTEMNPSHAGWRDNLRAVQERIAALEGR